MKKLLGLLLILLFARNADAFDMLGLQPVSPNGVFSTFSAESMQKDKAAVEITGERSNEPNFYRFDLRGAYGITDRVEFLMLFPYVYNYADSQNGIEDAAVGVKYRFYNEGKYGPSLACLVQASFSNGKDPFSTKGGYGAGLIVSKRVGPFKGHINVLYERPGTSRLNDELSFVGGVELSAAHNFKLMAELLARKSYFSNDYDLVEARAGYRMWTTEHVLTTLGVGADLKRRSPELRFLLSFTFLLPYEAKQIPRVYESE